ncbi:MAG: hypothetical protein LC722_04830 [Actinobacteria bacterium]|nr:hypothetical protein [Actinomycetota bacterium]
MPGLLARLVEKEGDRLKAVVEGRFVGASRNGKYIRGQFLSGGNDGVSSFYLNAEEDPQLADAVMGLNELDPFVAEVSCYANKGKDGSVYLSVRMLAIKKKARAAASAAS